MITETEHFILDYREAKNIIGLTWPLSAEYGLTVKIKNVNGTTTDVLYILPNKLVKFTEDPGTHIQTNGTMLQDSITSWELFVELVKLIDEAAEQVDKAVAKNNASNYIN